LGKIRKKEILEGGGPEKVWPQKFGKYSGFVEKNKGFQKQGWSRTKTHSRNLTILEDRGRFKL